MGMLVGGFFGQGSAGCDAGASAIPDQDVLVDSPTDAWVGAKWDSSDGEVYFYEANSQGFGASSAQVWKGSCANTEYDFRWILISGDTVDIVSIAVDVWQQASLGDLSCENRALGTASSTNSEIEFQLRRRSDSVTILTDRFFLDAETEDPTPK